MPETASDNPLRFHLVNRPVPNPCIIVIFGATGDLTRRKLIPAPGNGPLWARYYEIGSDRPIFGDRDKSIHDDVNEISKERRKGYGWYRDTPKRLLQHYRRWAAEHPPA